MKFEWDAAKNESNFAKHGIHCEEACEIFNGKTVTRRDSRQNYGESREISIESGDNQVVIVLVHTDRDGTTRIISARKANQKERRQYHEHIATTY